MLGQKKYTVSFAPNMNELGWNRDFDTMDEFDYFIHDVKEKAPSAILVFDNTAGQIIFWKRSLDRRPVIDLITTAP